MGNQYQPATITFPDQDVLINFQDDQIDREIYVEQDRAIAKDWDARSWVAKNGVALLQFGGLAIVFIILLFTYKYSQDSQGIASGVLQEALRVWERMVAAGQVAGPIN